MPEFTGAAAPCRKIDHNNIRSKVTVAHSQAHEQQEGSLAIVRSL
jgi:hypothetical protein